MTTTPHAAAAAAARQRLASVLATLQQDPNVPQSVLDILSGLARAMGPLFQLERGSADLQLFLTARTVLQETLEKIQVAEQGYPGVADATGAVAQVLGMIFAAMREAGMVPSAPAAAPQPQPQVMPNLVSPTPAAAPVPVAAPIPLAAPVAPQALKPMAAAPVTPYAPPAQAPIPLQQPVHRPSAPQAQHAPAPAGRSGAYAAVAAGGGSVPIGPNGVPRLESEIGVHSETNFFTDFLGDISNHGGIFVATFHVLALGAACEVIITFPGNLTAEVRGAVRWRRETADAGGASPGLGIEITQADKPAWDLIHRFINKREPIMHEM